MIELCDPANPQFISVVQARSPINIQLSYNRVPTPGSETRFELHLATASGKPIAERDVLVMHTQRLHLMVVDPTLRDYQHIHPVPGSHAGEWVFHHTPKLAGEYRVFVDLTPAATGRGLYASTAFEVTGAVESAVQRANWTVEQDEYRFELRPHSQFLAGQVVELAFTVSRRDGGAVPLQPVMDAYAHLVAFDEARKGFAHLHPNEVDLSKAPDSLHPRLTFKVTIPEPGRYVIWAQTRLDGIECFVPFWFSVAEASPLVNAASLEPTLSLS